MNKDIGDYNAELHFALDVLHRGKSEICLVDASCPNKTIWAHSVARSTLAKLQHDGHVITPKIRTKKDDSGRSALNLNFQQEGITQASTGTFACEEHD